MMKRKTKFALFLLMMISPALIMAQGRKTNFDKDWKFYKGCVANAEVPDFDDSKWRVLTIPHDWSIEPLTVQREGVTVGPFSKLSVGRWDTGQTVGGEGWYRKTFTLNKEDADKILTLHFEGAYNQSEVWVNGEKLAFNHYGYMPFKVSLNGHCKTDGSENVVAVKVVNEGLNSRWYAGSGLFRHVWLERTDPLHLDEWDTFVDASVVKGKNATVKLSALLHNENVGAKEGVLCATLYAPTGEQVAHAEEVFDVAGSNGKEVAVEMNVRNAKLWSVDNPQRYMAHIYICDNAGNEIDALKIPFGIRTISFSAEEGFKLNGEKMKLYGGCLHHDNGLLGAAAVDSAEVRKVKLMKEQGFNAVRCSHNLPAESFLNACDSIGMLVIDEVFDQWEEAKRDEDYHRYFTEYCEQDMSLMVRRDRNHPSIIMWSIGNEIAQRADDPRGVEIAKILNNAINKYDTSRPSTMAVNSFWDRRQFKWETDSWRAFAGVGVGGYNYEWGHYESDHEAYPDRIMYGSESYPKEMAQNWNLIFKNEYLIGDFVWTSIDYVGEAGLGHALELAGGEHSPQFMDWPWYNAWCGDIDLIGDKKPQSYYRDIIWNHAPVAMAVRPPVAEGKREDVNGWGWTAEENHWTWTGREGEQMTVHVYSRAPKVRLYLNGKLVGEQATDKETYTATFKVPYEAGELKAQSIGKREYSGEIVFTTAGKPAKIKLDVDNNQIAASSNSLSYIGISVLDANDNLVPNAEIPLKVEYSGAKAEVIGGNAHYSDMNSFRTLNPKTFRGRAMVVVRPQNEKGSVVVSVKSDGLEAAQTEIVLK